MEIETETLWESPRFQVKRRIWTDSTGRRRKREFVDHPGAVAILPWIDERHICLIRNERPAIGQTLLEIPAGTREPGEEALATARRELAEETGYEARSWEPLLRFWTSPGVLREEMHLFVARDLAPGVQQLDESERIEPVVVPWRDALEWAMAGRIVDAKTLVAILLYERAARKGGDA